MPLFLLANSSVVTLSYFSSPPPIPSNLNTATHPPSLPIPIPIPAPLPRKHSRKDNKEEERQGHSENGEGKGKGKGKGKQVYKHRGWYTTMLGEEKGVIIGEEGGMSYKVAGAPFEFKFSYSEMPKVKPLALREPPFVPFARQTVNRPWTGRVPVSKSKKMLPELESFKRSKLGIKGAKDVQPPGPFFMANGPNYRASTREEILGNPLTAQEKSELLKESIPCTRQVNLGRDGLTHNMLELVHTHWKRQQVCKIKCKGVPTIDMSNICHHLEEKTGGKIIHRIGGVVHLFRGRNYNYRSRPRFPLMLWKPATPVYPKLILRAPEGLTVEEADALRRKGRHLPSICKLAKFLSGFMTWDHWASLSLPTSGKTFMWGSSMQPCLLRCNVYLFHLDALSKCFNSTVIKYSSFYSFYASPPSFPIFRALTLGHAVCLTSTL